MCLGGAEEHTFGDDDSGAATWFEQGEEACEEEQLGFLGADQAGQGRVEARCVDAAGERRVREDQVEGLLVLVRDRLKCIAVADVRVLEAVHEHVHRGDAHHRGVEVEAGQAGLVVALAQAGVEELFLVMAASPFGSRHEEAGGAGCRVDDPVGGRWAHELDHEVDDVARGAELPVSA